MPPASGADTIRILVATDNHVGFEERDPIRKDDSWKTFDEIMQLAKKQDVDMVLLGGDLFHENKPSRKSMFQVMRTLRKNCLGMRPCELEFLSDAAEVFEGSAFPHVNYQDPDINISIPVFSIHGNHDDPSGDGHYCTLDLLQVAGLVNYFGRVPEVDNIQVKPILLQKGNTKLALYGVSNVRDERMHRTFRDNKVKWFRPNQQKSDFFNILTVHQNHYAHSPTDYLAENMLPEFMDLVIWGHEHECLIDPTYNPETNFRVMQPGSSVATSLVPGEAVTKQVAILNITGKDMAVEKFRLKTVRPFITREIALAADKRFKGLDKKKEHRQEVTKRLIGIVNEMIEEANAEWLSLQEESDQDQPQIPPLPLIRLKVEYSTSEGGTFEVENKQRFSNRFIGKVANTNDVVAFHRKKQAATRLKNGVVIPEEALAAIAQGSDIVQVETLVREYLAAQSLKLLPQAQFGDAVANYVNKEDKDRMEDFVVNTLANSVQELLAMDDDESRDLDANIERIRKAADVAFSEGRNIMKTRKRLKPKPDGWDSDMDGHWVNDKDAFEDVPVAPEATTQNRGRGRQPAKKVAARDEEEDDFDEDEDINMDDDDAEEEAPPPPKRAPAKRATAAKAKAAPAKKAAPVKKAPARGRKKVVEESEEEEEDVVMDDDDDDFEAVAPVPTKAAPAKRAQPARSSAKTKQSTLNFSQSQRPAARAAAGRSTQTALEISDDEIEEEDAFESMPVTRGSRRR